jgi:hypothetical protein
MADPKYQFVDRSKIYTKREEPKSVPWPVPKPDRFSVDPKTENRIFFDNFSNSNHTFVRKVTSTPISTNNLVPVFFNIPIPTWW